MTADAPDKLSAASNGSSGDGTADCRGLMTASGREFVETLQNYIQTNSNSHDHEQYRYKTINGRLFRGLQSLEASEHPARE